MGVRGGDISRGVREMKCWERERLVGRLDLGGREREGSTLGQEACKGGEDNSNDHRMDRGFNKRHTTYFIFLKDRQTATYDSAQGHSKFDRMNIKTPG